MSDQPEAFLRIAYCKDLKSGAWESIDGWESMATFTETLKTGCAQGNTKGLHPVLSWGLSSTVADSSQPSDKMTPGKPGILSVALDPGVTPVGQMYEAHFGRESGSGLINYQLYVFRANQARGSADGSTIHHYLTVTGIAGRIAQIDQSTGGFHVVLAANRISWCDHDGSGKGVKGAHTSWEKPGTAGNDNKAMPSSPI